MVANCGVKMLPAGAPGGRSRSLRCQRSGVDVLPVSAHLNFDSGLGLPASAFLHFKGVGLESGRVHTSAMLRRES
jgi:hypothetical protein